MLIFKTLSKLLNVSKKNFFDTFVVNSSTFTLSPLPFPLTFAKSLLLSSCIAIVLFPTLAKAQIQVTPLVIEAEAKRGQAQGIIEVTNRGSEPFRARVYAEPFTYDSNGFKIIESDGSDLTNFLQFSPRELVIEPGVTRRIRMVSRFPPSLATGEYRAVIFTESLEATATGGGDISIGVIPRIGVTVYVRQGDVTPNLAVQSASFDSQQQQISLLVNNSGTASVRPWLEWNLQQGETTVATGKIEPITVITQEERNIFLESPNTEITWIPGEYQLTGTLFWGNPDNPEQLPFSFSLVIP